MTQQDYRHPITPPPELVQQWIDEIHGGPGVLVASSDICLAKLAAQWGADQELEACCELMDDWGLDESDLRAARRPQPLSLKKQALKALKSLQQRTTDPSIIEPLRRALEQLPDHE